MVLLELVIISDLYHLISSNPSLKIESVITTTKGEIADKGFNGDIEGNDYKTATIKKYTLE